SVQATAHPCAVLMVVSGPIVQELGMNFSHGVFGPGNRANAAMGRAMRLVLINVGGAIPGRGDQSSGGAWVADVQAMSADRDAIAAVGGGKARGWSFSRMTLDGTRPVVST
ncbi:MAG: hypothetical protein IIC82_08610, partial [Chloroflexi bacterium]|nr:hypothetical protein [Chloroflexota bacterium]